MSREDNHGREKKQRPSASTMPPGVFEEAITGPALAQLLRLTGFDESGTLSTLSRTMHRGVEEASRRMPRQMAVRGYTPALRLFPTYGANISILPPPRGRADNGSVSAAHSIAAFCETARDVDNITAECILGGVPVSTPHIVLRETFTMPEMKERVWTINDVSYINIGTMLRAITSRVRDGLTPVKRTIVRIIHDATTLGHTDRAVSIAFEQLLLDAGAYDSPLIFRAWFEFLRDSISHHIMGPSYWANHIRAGRLREALVMMRAERAQGDIVQLSDAAGAVKYIFNALAFETDEAFEVRFELCRECYQRAAFHAAARPAYFMHAMDRLSLPVRDHQQLERAKRLVSFVLETTEHAAVFDSNHTLENFVASCRRTGDRKPETKIFMDELAAYVADVASRRHGYVIQ